MNQQGIQVFLAIVKHNGITAAAKALNYTQPTVSEHLKVLEKQLGVRLIVRRSGSKQVVLTPAGEAFLPLAQRYKEVTDAIERFISTQNQKVFRLAASENAHGYIVPHIVRRLMQKNPGVEIHLISKEIREIPSAIEMNAFDAALYFGSTLESPAYQRIPFFREERYIFCRKDTELPDRMLTPEDLDPQKEVMYQTISKKSKFSMWHEECFPDSTGSTLHIESIYALKNHLTSPDAWAVVPASIARNVLSQQNDWFTLRRITPQPPDRVSSLLISKMYPHEEIMQSFLQSCNEFVEEHPDLHPYKL